MLISRNLLVHYTLHLNLTCLSSERCEAIALEQHKENLHEIYPQTGFVGLPQKRAKIDERNSLVE